MSDKIVVDYRTSTKRLGSKTPHGKLAKCPKCGERGALSPETFNECDGKVWSGTVRHYVTGGLGQPSAASCWLPLSEKGEKLRAVKNIFEGLRELVRAQVAEDFAAAFPEYRARTHKAHGRNWTGTGPACHGPLQYKSRINVPVAVLLELLASQEKR